MDEQNKEIPNAENEATPEQPAVVREETGVAQEVAREPVLQEAEPALVMEPPAEGVRSDGEQTPTPESSEAPTIMEEPARQGETASPEREPQTEGREQTGEALVEMLDAAQPQDGAPGPADASSFQPSASEESPTIESVIEAVLFASDEPLPESKLAGIVETTAKQVRECVDSLNARYEANHNAFRVEQIAGGYQMLTQPIYNSWLKKMVKVRSDNKLSPAAMETLAIIAYKQPIIRADIEAIRGVAVGEVIRSLMYKGLVKIAGRAEILGRPMLYGTTKKFLEIFGLNSVKDLPKAEDLKNPDRG
jgi:segregation and condensation protein B